MFFSGRVVKRRMSFTRNFMKTDVDPNYVNAEFFKAIRLSKQDNQDVFFSDKRAKSPVRFIS